MNRKDITRMAREAGAIHIHQNPKEFAVVGNQTIERFAALVAAAEREAILLMLKGIDQTDINSPDGWWETSKGAEFGAGVLAAIRARGQA